MRKTNRALIFAALIILGAHLALSQTHATNKGLKVELDPAQTTVKWKLGGLHTTHGTFKLKSGEIFFNPATGVAEGEVLIDATSGESGNSERDQRMHAEVLESNRYPAIFFHPSQLKGEFRQTGATQQLVGQGTFNIHGADHPIELPLTVQVTGATVSVTTKFAVPYVAWGMKDPSKFLFRVGKQVDIEVTAKGSIKPAE